MSLRKNLPSQKNIAFAYLLTHVLCAASLLNGKYLKLTLMDFAVLPKLMFSSAFDFETQHESYSSTKTEYNKLFS
jgi:hypothetical protein